jgi:hypothetical protein
MSSIDISSAGLLSALLMTVLVDDECAGGRPGLPFDTIARLPPAGSENIQRHVFVIVYRAIRSFTMNS